jgi:hypothetical protein
MALFGLVDVDGIVVDSLRSDRARSEIRSQISEALKSDALAPLLGEAETQIRSEGQAAIGQLKRMSEEVRAGLAAALRQEAERLRAEMVTQLEAFLRSAEGKELLAGLLVEALSRRALPELIQDAETRLNEDVTGKVAELCADAEISIEKYSEDRRAQLQCEVEAFNLEAGGIALTLSERVFREAEKQLQGQHDSLIASSWGEVQRRVDDFIEFHFPRVLSRAVERHVASGPRFVQPHSNRWLAAELRVSVREVKRRRRRGEIPWYR